MAAKTPDHELVRRIATGSYGEVWLARNSLGTWRAVKIITRSRFNDERPYIREYKGVTEYEPASREHEHLVDILHVGRDDQAGCFYYVMELADALPPVNSPPIQPTGADPPELKTSSESFAADNYLPHSLEAELKRRGRFPTRDCLTIGIALVRAIEFLHNRGLIHRDVKLGNVIYVNGIPKLADVGLVTSIQDAHTRVGTEGYIPPEGPVTPSTDLYGLAKVLYELATGQDRMEFPELPSLIGDPEEDARLLELNQVILKACQPDPAMRYCSAREMREELELLARGGSVRERRRSKRRAFQLAWGAAIAVLLVTGVSMLLAHSGGLTRIDSFSNPAILNWQSSVFAQIDHNPEREIVLPTFPRLTAFDCYGQLIRQTQEIASEGVLFQINMAEDINQDGVDEFLVSWTEDTNMIIKVVNMNSLSLGRFQSQGGNDAEKPSHMLARRIIDLEGGRRGVVANMDAGYRLFPRGICCFDYDTGECLWRFETAPHLNPFEFLDLDHDGILDVLCGSGSPCNGYRLPDGTDDLHSYCYAISSKGKLLWRKEIGDAFTSCEVFSADLNGDRLKEILMRIGSSFEFRQDKTNPEPASICRLNESGSVLAQYHSQFNFWPVTTTSDLDGDGKLEVLAPDRKGVLHVLDSNLNLIKKVGIDPARFTSTWINNLVVDDLDGDRWNEIALYSFQVEYVEERNMGHPKDAPPKTKYYNAQVLILNHRLEPIARKLLADESYNPPFYSLRVVDLYGDGRPKLLLLGDRVEVFELRRSLVNRWLDRFR